MDLEVIDYVNTNLIAVKMHADSVGVKDLIEHYKISEFPTIVFVDKDGTEIDRIIGYLPSDKFLKELKRIQSGVGTIPNLIIKTKNIPSKFETWMKLASKYEDRGDLKSATEVWESVAEAGLGNEEFVNYKLIELHGFINKDVIDLEYFIADNLNSEYAQYAFQSVISILRKNNNQVEEADAWRRYINLMELKKMYTPSLYNSFAWRMSELELNLEEALEKIRIGIGMIAEEDTSNLAGYMDTEAEVLWKMGNIDKAVEVIDNCIALQPDDKYFKDQKAKFLE